MSAVVERAGDVLMLAGITVSLPFLILLVGAPVALGIRELLRLFGWL